MGVPVLFTDTAGVPELIVVPFPGLFLSDELYLGDDVYLDDGPTLQFYGATPTVTDTGITVAVDAAIVTFSGGDATLPTVTDIVVTVFPEPVVFSGGDVVEITGNDLVVSVDAAVVTFSATLPETTGSQLVILVPSVRELPPLRLHHLIRTPSGRHFRWAEDDPNPANVPSAVRFSDTMPGGFETGDAVLPRKSSDDSRDLERLSDWTIAGAGGEVAWQGRLERAPRTSGDQVSVSPSGVGWQANLDDDQSVSQIYIDRDLSRWRGISPTRNISLDNSFTFSDPSVDTDQTSGNSPLRMGINGSWTARLPAVEAWYDAGPDTKVAGLWFTPTYSSITALGAANWNLVAFVSDDDLGSATTNGPTVHPPSTTFYQFFPATPRRFALIQWWYALPNSGVDGVDFNAWLNGLVVLGNHGIVGDGIGYKASDIVTHAVNRFASALNISARSVQPSGFSIPQMTFYDRTTAGEIVKQATRFGLQDWAVWDNHTFWFHDRGAHGRKWRLRVGPSNLQETGQAADRIYNSVIVEYQDVDGSTRTVGPPGSGSDWEEPAFADSDPENQATKAGLKRRALLTMGTSAQDPFTLRPSAPIEVGLRFLEEHKQLDHSGQASVTGHAMDDRGVLHPYWAMRSGDLASFVDASDASYRRIVRTDKDHPSRTCNLDLDAPPEGLQALLERLGVTLVPLGIN